nr:NAD(P)-binding domain-containing protein [Mammaliicoccus sp. Marseille-Q6498]
MNIGFIGYGEVGSEMSKGFSEYEVDNIFAYDPLLINKSSEKISDNTKLTYFPNTKELSKQKMSILFVAVPASKAIEAWLEIRDTIDKETILVDLTTANAKEKNMVNEIMNENGLHILDAAILGALKVYQNTVPILVSGSQSEKFVEIGQNIGMKITKLNENVGDATNFKYIRSIFTKGLSTLLYEVMEAAEKLQIEQEIYNSISNTMDKDDFGEIINRYIKSNVKHSKRRETEMENVSNFMKDNNLETYMTEATISKLKDISNAELENELQDENYNWIDVIKTMNQK